MLHAIGNLSPSIMYASTRVIPFPLTDACASMGTLVCICIKKGDTSGWNARILSV